MSTLKNSLLCFRSFRIAALLLLALAAGSGPLSFAQDSVQGTLHLPLPARVGTTTLPPGDYKFTISMIGATHSMRDLQGPSHVSVLLTGTAKGTPIAGAIAMAVPLAPNDPKPVNFLPEGDGLMVRSIALDDFGVVLNFYEAGKTVLHANSAKASQTVVSGKGGD